MVVDAALSRASVDVLPVIPATAVVMSALCVVELQRASAYGSACVVGVSVVVSVVVVSVLAVLSAVVVAVSVAVDSVLAVLS